MQAKSENGKSIMTKRSPGELASELDTFNSKRGRIRRRCTDIEHVQSTTPCSDRQSKRKLKRTKVERIRLSELARWILLHTGDGTDRGQIAEGFFKLERLYCGWYVDPCYNPKVRRERDSKYKKAQPLITKTLWRLQRLRLVELIKHGKCVKKIRLTAAGKAVVQQLVEDGDIETDKV